MRLWGRVDDVEMAMAESVGIEEGKEANDRTDIERHWPGHGRITNVPADKLQEHLYQSPKKGRQGSYSKTAGDKGSQSRLTPVLNFSLLEERIKGASSSRSAD